MKLTGKNHVFATGLLLLALSLLPAGQVLAHAGKVLFVNGHATADSAKRGKRSLQRGSKVWPGDIVVTGANSKIQIRAGDGSMISLQQNTRFKIIKHKHTGDPAKQSSLVDLIKGGMRAVTGAIGKNHPENFKIQVKQSTIGIRGTEFIVQVCEDDCSTRPDAKQDDEIKNGVYIGVLSGAVTVAQKEQEPIDLDASLDMVMGVSMGVSKTKKQYVFIGDKEDAKPITLPEPPKVILQALAPPPVTINKATKNKRHHSLSTYSGVDTMLFAKNIDQTRPVEKAFSAVERFDALAYPTAPDVLTKNRFVFPALKGTDINSTQFFDLDNGFSYYPP